MYESLRVVTKHLLSAFSSSLVLRRYTKFAHEKPSFFQTLRTYCMYYKGEERGEQQKRKSNWQSPHEVEVRACLVEVPKVIRKKNKVSESGIITELHSEYRLCTELYLHVTFLCYMCQYYASLTISIY
jgi:hypothetical protein